MTYEDFHTAYSTFRIANRCRCHTEVFGDPNRHHPRKDELGEDPILRFGVLKEFVRIAKKAAFVGLKGDPPDYIKSALLRVRGLIKSHVGKPVSELLQPLQALEAEFIPVLTELVLAAEGRLAPTVPGFTHAWRAEIESVRAASAIPTWECVAKWMNHLKRVGALPAQHAQVPESAHSIPIATQQGPARKIRRGRPRTTDPKADAKLYALWENDDSRTYAEFAAKQGISAKEFGRAADRHRKRKPASE